MIVAPDNVWAALDARKNKEALQWRDKSFPYFDDLFALYDGHYAQGRSCHGMDHYANKAKQSSQVSPSHSPPLQVPEVHLQSPSLYLLLGNHSCIFFIEEDTEGPNLFNNGATFDDVATNPTQGNDSAFHAPITSSISTNFFKTSATAHRRNSISLMSKSTAI